MEVVKRIIFTIACFVILVSSSVSEVKTVRLRGGVALSGLQPEWAYSGTELAPGYRGGKDIVLVPSAYVPDVGTELLLHFDAPFGRDATGSWALRPEPAFRISKPAYMGAGAAAFSGPGSKLSLEPPAGSLFGAGTSSGDFSVEFWLRPSNVEEGEVVYSWSSSIVSGGKFRGQSAVCTIAASKLSFSFRNFFAVAGGGRDDYTIKGKSLLVPRAWSHHIVRFDSDSGLLEYAMNGVPEAVLHVTDSGREGGTVYLPLVGTGGKLDLGVSYSGMVDELRVSRAFIARPTLRARDFSSGYAFSPVVDLRYTGSELVSLEAIKRVPGNAGIEFSVRSGDVAGLWAEDNPPWVPVREGVALGGKVLGRFVQVRTELFPDGEGGASPALSEIVLNYREDDPPPPPARVLALPGNGEVKLSWSAVAESDLGGYLVYYGPRPGDYSGTGSSLGPSPIDVGNPLAGKTGNTATVTIPGLRNGDLVFFSVAAYDSARTPHVGEFSREVSARPSRTAP